MDDITEGDVQLGGVSIHYYRTGGNKPALVMVHGFSDNGLCWFRTAESLRSTFDVVMVDARNHGKSGRGPASSEALAEDLAGLIEALGLDKPIVLGHSMGASSAARMAARFPDRVSRLLLEDPPWSKTETKEKSETTEQIEKRQAGFRAWLKSMSTQSEQDLIQVGRNQYPDWHDEDLPAWAASKLQVSETAMDGLNLSTWADLVDLIQCPTLLIHTDGKRDGLLKQGVVDQVTKQNSLITAACIKGAGHNTRREQFDQYIAAVKEFVR